MPGMTYAQMDKLLSSVGFTIRVATTKNKVRVYEHPETGAELPLAYRPDEFRAFFAYHDALMEKEGGLTKAEREMIVVATSAANQCHYCVIAHGAILRIRAKNPQIADQIAVNYRKADITPRQRAMLDFAMKVSTEAHKISERDFTDIAGHGFSDDDIWDIAAISAFFALSNRLANVTGMRANGEFYMLGRLPK